MHSGVIELIKEIKNIGGRGLLVGGCVRDKLMGLPDKDTDLEVFGLPPDTLKRLCKKYGRINMVGASFAVLKVQFPDGVTVDVSVPRRERQTSEGHRGFDVEADPFMTPEEAAQRRDLTINAISLDPLTNEIIDPVDGQSDLKSGILRHVSRRFREDPLRVLRVIQFMARFDFKIAPETFKLCAEMTADGQLNLLPRERIEEEIRKLFVLGVPQAVRTALETAEQMGIWQKLLPELQQLRGIPQDPRHHSEGDCLAHTFLTVEHAARIAVRDACPEEARWVLCLAALGHDLGKAETTEVRPDGSITAYQHERAGVPLAETMIRRITANARIIDPVVALIKAHMRPLHLVLAENVSDAAIRRLARDIQPAGLGDLIRLVEADTAASIRSESSVSAEAHVYLLQRVQSLGVETRPPEPLFQGRDLIRLAKEEKIPQQYLHGGIHFKSILDAVYERQLQGDIKNLGAAEALVIELTGAM
jgi:tRNA nucleotidyltransferase (CCA-adding enzyme)